MISSSSLKILSRNRTKKENIYLVNVENNEDEEEETLILKEIPIQNSKSHCINVNPCFSEFMINTIFNCPNLYKSRYCIFHQGKGQIFLEEAQGTMGKIKPANFEMIERWISSLIEGVMFLHSRRLIHGDIKASNVLIDRENEAKLADFGMVTLIVEGETQKFPNRGMMYTLTHRPPEVSFGNVWGFSADIWALGCTFYELLYNEKIFTKEETKEEYINKINKNLVYSKNVKYDSLNALIFKMLNVSPEKRPSIFEVNEIFSERNKRILSGSPDSVTSSFFRNFPICNKVYSRYNIVNKSYKNFIIENLPRIINVNENVFDLVASLFENSSPRDYMLTLKSCLIIIYLIVYRVCPPIVIHQENITEIYRISEYTQFNYINWPQFYKSTT